MNGWPRTVHVVVHTHWDREWYLPRAATLARARSVLSRVCALLDSGELSTFLFDGQTVAFVELLEAAEPALREALLRHARSGALVLGPWYVMSDEFLVSGESLARNLELGLADTKRHGAHGQAVGYLPDSFGHAAQMPEVLRQFGIGSAVLWRGADAQASTFDWVAPSGAVAGTVYLPEGYYLHPLNAAAASSGTHAAAGREHADLGEEAVGGVPDWAAPLDRLLQRIQAHTPSGPLLLTHGGDHLAPAVALAQRLADFNAAQPRWRLRLATLADHVQAALEAGPGPGSARERIGGELRRNRSAFVLPDVLSTRRYLKRLHQRAEDRLLGEIEPLLAVLWPAHEAWPARWLERCWRTLVEQQAHDSLCGCSIDAVHEEMVQRFAQLDQELDALRAATLHACAATTAWQHEGGDVWADDRCFTLFNPLPLPREGWWPLELFVRDDVGGTLAVHDEEGRCLPCEQLEAVAHAELVSPLDDFPERLAGRRVRLRLRAALPGLGWCRLRLVAPRDQAAPTQPPLGTACIENAAWRVELDEQGRLRLHDLRAGRVQALSVLSELDAGDSYTFSPPARPAQVHEVRWGLRRVVRGPHVQRLEVGLALRTPASLDDARLGASAQTVLNEGVLGLELCADAPTLTATLDWDNRACDQRTRLLLPLADAETATGADSAWAWVEREAVIAQVPGAPSPAEMPVAVMPSLGALTAGPWAVAHRALHEFEIVEHGGQRFLALTVVRSVGWLSRRDLRTRGVGAGPDLPTPKAQCLGCGRDTFVLVAAAPGQSRRDAALAAAADLRRPMLALRGHVRGDARPVEIGDARLQVSAVRRVAGQLEVRAWNPTTEPLALGESLRGWQAVWADGRSRTEPAGASPAGRAPAPGPHEPAPQPHAWLGPHAVGTWREPS